MERPPIWLTGDRDHAEFAPAVAWLSRFAVVAAAAPAAIVACQSRPGSIAQDEIEALHARAPLARLIVLTGTWCEGEVRSGRPCQGVIRIAWQQWRHRLPQELATAPFRPRTLTEVDRLSQMLTPGLARRPGLAAIATASRETYLAIADACSAAGLRSLWQLPDEPPSMPADVLLLDGWGSHRPHDRLHDSVASAPPSILLLDWPRASDLDRATEVGIGSVLARPWLLGDLLAALELAACQQPSASAAVQSAA